MSDMQEPGDHTPKPFPRNIDPIASSCLTGWPKIQLSWGPRRINVRSRILLPFPSSPKAQSSGSIDSGRREVLARRGQSLPVSLPRLLACYAAYAIQPSLYRWEFFITLDYEWGVIRRRLPYRWTILVRNNRYSALFLFAMLRPWVDLLIR
jgi:hypothetical protein